MADSGHRLKYYNNGIYSVPLLDNNMGEKSISVQLEGQKLYAPLIENKYDEHSIVGYSDNKKLYTTSRPRLRLKGSYHTSSHPQYGYTLAINDGMELSYPIDTPLYVSPFYVYYSSSYGYTSYFSSGVNGGYIEPNTTRTYQEPFSAGPFSITRDEGFIGVSFDGTHYAIYRCSGNRQQFNYDIEIGQADFTLVTGSGKTPMSLQFTCKISDPNGITSSEDIRLGFSYSNDASLGMYYDKMSKDISIYTPLKKDISTNIYNAYASGYNKMSIFLLDSNSTFQEVIPKLLPGYLTPCLNLSSNTTVSTTTNFSVPLGRNFYYL